MADNGMILKPGAAETVQRLLCCHLHREEYDHYRHNPVRRKWRQFCVARRAFRFVGRSHCLVSCLWPPRKLPWRGPSLAVPWHDGRAIAKGVNQPKDLQEANKRATILRSIFHCET